MQEAFGLRRASTLANLLENRFLNTAIPAPLDHEREPGYTARCLAPVVVDLIRSRGLSEVSCLGDGLGPVPKVYFLGVEQKPDIALVKYEERLVAMEVKYLRPSGRSSQACVGLGQSLLYQRAGFAISMGIFIDLSGSLSLDDVIRAKRLFEGIANYRLLFFNKRKRVLEGLFPQAV